MPLVASTAKNAKNGTGEKDNDCILCKSVENRGMSKPTQLDYLNRALAQAGEVSQIAYVCGVTPSAIYEWRRNCIPARHVKTLCAMRGVTVTPNQLRPDVF